MLNHQLAAMTVNFVVGMLARNNGTVARIEQLHPDMVLLQMNYEPSFDAALASAVRWLDSLSYDERFRLFCNTFLNAPLTAAQRNDGGARFARRWTQIYVAADASLFAEDIDAAWQRLRERLVVGLSRTGYPYAPVTELPVPKEA